MAERFGGSGFLIDSHQHVFWHGRDDRGLVEDMNEHGIAKSWLLSWEEASGEAHFNHSVVDPRNKGVNGAESMLPLSGVIEACRQYPDRFVPGYCPHPLDPNAISKLSAAIDIFGVAVCGEWKFCILIDDPRCIELFRFAGSRGLPVVLHLDVPYLPPRAGTYVGQGAWRGGTLDNLINTLEACPETSFIGHGPGFWRELDGNADDLNEIYLSPPLAPGGRLEALFRVHPNLFADLSADSALKALAADPDHAREFLVEYSSRLLFGRDRYGGQLLEFLRGLEIPEEVWMALGRENAEALTANHMGRANM